MKLFHDSHPHQGGNCVPKYLCEAAVEYNLPCRKSLLLCCLYCVLRYKNEIIEEHLRWSLKVVSPDAAKWQFMFTVFPSECWYMQFLLLHTDMMLGIWSTNNSSESC